MRNPTSEEFSVFLGAIYAAILAPGFCALASHVLVGLGVLGRRVPALRCWR
jgi:hypothetical protein